uniref:Tyrosine-protein phosphatase domain-containing protein n=1 Tax=Anisakis simplex TaxID=6269 RepID=A0A0M3JEL3_ANISI
LSYGEPISVECFDQYCCEMSANNNEKFRQQFEDIEKDSMMNGDLAIDGHRSKDRYLNIYACEPTRIKIASGTSDYINANYIDVSV